MDGPPFAAAHIAGMVAHFTGMPARTTGIRPVDETMETKRWRRDDEVISTSVLTHVGHLGHHMLTPAAGSS
jgi:hypothetical protein